MEVKSLLNSYLPLLFLFNWYSGKYGLTISLEDSRPKKIKEFNVIKGEEFDNLNSEVLRMPKLIYPTDFEKLEREQEIMTLILNKIDKVTKIFFDDYLERDNTLGVMVESKAKGKTEQIKNISAFIGQQFINGQNRTEKSYFKGKKVVFYL